MIVKVCGRREPDTLRAMNTAGADWIAFDCSPKAAQGTGSVSACATARAKRIGVFVNASAEFILHCVTAYALDGIELHGQETPGFCQILHELLPPGHLRPLLIKSFAISVPEDFTATYGYAPWCDCFLFDIRLSEGDLVAASLSEPAVPLCNAAELFGETPASLGNSSVSLPRLLHRYRGSTPFLLGGEMRPACLASLSVSPHPAWVGIDLGNHTELLPEVSLLLHGNTVEV